MADVGALSVAIAEECRDSKPKTTARAVVSRADRGADDGRRRSRTAPFEGPTAYSVGPSEYIGAGQHLNRWEVNPAQREQQPVFGEAMQRAMAERGCDMSLEESQEFVRVLLRLVDIHALTFVDEDGNVIPLA